MYLHKISLANKSLRWGRKGDLDIYSLHQRIWGIVSQSKRQKRDFLYRVEYDAYQNIKFIYILAPSKVEQQEDYNIEVSPKFNPQIETGEDLYFILRANPIVRKKKSGRAKDCDIIMDAKHEYKRNGHSYLDMFSMDELIHNEGMKWLGRKGAHHGFTVKKFDAKIYNYQEYLIKTEGRQSFSLKTLDFEGKLTIVDKDSFIATLFRGIGSAKAFGCGLMLVRRI